MQIIPHFSCKLNTSWANLCLQISTHLPKFPSLQQEGFLLISGEYEPQIPVGHKNKVTTSELFSQHKKPLRKQQGAVRGG